ncbi:MAG: hypothetical protein ACYCSW_03745 [bacterium]
MSNNNLRKIGDTYYYDITVDNVRYRGTTKTTDKKLAQNITDTIKSDILRKKHTLPSTINYHFIDLWELYLSVQSTGIKNHERKIIAAKHFLPFFENKSIQSISKDNIETYPLKRKLELLALPKNKDKRESEIARFLRDDD